MAYLPSLLRTRSWLHGYCRPLIQNRIDRYDHEVWPAQPVELLRIVQGRRNTGIGAAAR